MLALLIECPVSSSSDSLRLSSSAGVNSCHIHLSYHGCLTFCTGCETATKAVLLLLAVMSRPIVLVFLLVVLIITSQFEWKQQFGNDMESSPSVSQKQNYLLNREEVIKEKIILSQEKNIQRLNLLVQSLQQQLLQCQDSTNKTATVIENSLKTNANSADGSKF